MSKGPPVELDFRRRGEGWRLTTELVLPRPPQEVFPFFSDAANLQKLTPRFLRFQILSPQPIEMRCGAVIDYRLRLRGLPLQWRTEITEWDPPYRFVDTQLEGPYRWWIHQHQFLAEGDTTRAVDTVDYGITCGRLLHPLFIRRDLQRIFTYRAAMLAQEFPA